ncbi:MAG: L-threonylcarbamoyladenylate synthase [Angustibacter sp.]
MTTVTRIDVRTDDGRASGTKRAADAVQRGDVVVLPTDTVYGIGADAFAPAAVAAVLEAKGRGRSMPPPVLVPSPKTIAGLTYGLTPAVRELIVAFWPGPLTLVCHAQPTLAWDLGDTGGTVALRMPLHRVALALLELTGPMAVTSANRTGQPPATTVDEAVAQLGDAVSVYLDGGPSSSSTASTIVDVTGPVPVLVRAGPIGLDRLRAVALDVEDGTADHPDATEPADGPPPAPDADHPHEEDAR